MPTPATRPVQTVPDFPLVKLDGEDQPKFDGEDQPNFDGEDQPNFDGEDQPNFGEDAPAKNGGEVKPN